MHHKFKDNFDFLDYILLSTTIQAGVGISDIYPVSVYGKIIMSYIYVFKNNLKKK